MADKKSGIELLRGVAEILILPAVYLFFLGFMYAYYFYSHFGVQLQSLGVPQHFYLMYSFSVIYQSWWLLLPYVIAVSAMVYLGIAGRRWAFVVSVAALVALFPLLWIIGRTAGTRDAAALRSGYGVKHVRVALGSDAEASCSSDLSQPSEGRVSTRACLPASLPETDALVFLAQTGDYFIILHQPAPHRRAQTVVPIGRVIWLAKEDAKLVEVLVLNQREVEQ
jgi:hypothetical protein